MHVKECGPFCLQYGAGRARAVRLGAHAGALRSPPGQLTALLPRGQGQGKGRTRGCQGIRARASDARAGELGTWFSSRVN